MPRVAAGRNR